MASRLELQSKLEEILGSRNVYYQPPSNINIGYPAIVYSKSNYKSTHANDAVYSIKTRYSITVIDKKPDNEVIEKIMGLPYCSYDRHYTSDNLNHDVLTLYF